MRPVIWLSGRGRRCTASQTTMPDDYRTPTEHPEAHAAPPGPSPTKHPEAYEPVAGPSASAPASPTPTEHPEAHEPKKTKRSGHFWLWVLLVLVLLGIGLYFLWPTISGEKAAAAKAAAKGPPPIPVVAAKSRKGDIGVYYSGLGAVTPLATVTVRTRVDGQLMSVRYREGDTVQKGDLLAEIDDGPYQAALTQAQGQLHEGPGRPGKRAHRPGPLSTVGSAESRPGATACHPTGNRASGRGNRETRSGSNRKRPGQSGLLQDRGSGHGAHRVAAGGPREYRSSRPTPTDWW